MQGRIGEGSEGPLTGIRVLDLSTGVSRVVQ